MEMEAVESMKYVGMGLAALGMLGGAIGAGLIFGNAAQGIARNPGAEAKIRSTAILGAVFAELMGLLSFVVAMIIMYG
jgi:F-type H+-transporting ATPase subunit c